jgi:hypothetical protein
MRKRICYIRIVGSQVKGSGMDQNEDLKARWYAAELCENSPRAHQVVSLVQKGGLESAKKRAIRTKRAKFAAKTVENHKGNWCPYSNRFCQEGLCSGCQVFLGRVC